MWPSFWQLHCVLYFLESSNIISTTLEMYYCFDSYAMCFGQQMEIYSSWTLIKPHVEMLHKWFCDTFEAWRLACLSILNTLIAVSASNWWTSPSSWWEWIRRSTSTSRSPRRMAREDLDASRASVRRIRPLRAVGVMTKSPTSNLGSLLDCRSNTRSESSCSCAWLKKRGRRARSGRGAWAFYTCWDRDWRLRGIIRIDLCLLILVRWMTERLCHLSTSLAKYVDRQMWRWSVAGGWLLMLTTRNKGALLKINSRK